MSEKRYASIVIRPSSLSIFMSEKVGCGGKDQGKNINKTPLRSQSKRLCESKPLHGYQATSFRMEKRKREKIILITITKTTTPKALNLCVR